LNPLDIGNAEVISNIADFDKQSGSFLEKLLFNNRPIILALCLFATIGLGFEALHTKLSVSFSQMIPVHNSFIINYLKHYEDLQGQGNAIQIAVVANQGTIISRHYLQVLQHLNDQIYLLPGVDRPFMASLWTPNTRWTAITPEGLDAGPVISQDYDGSSAQLAIVKQNIYKSGLIGSLIANDFKSSIIYVPLLEHNNKTGKTLDYGQLTRQLNQIRRQYAGQGVTLKIIGFAVIVGDMINGMWKILGFFLAALFIATCILFWYTRCARSTAMVVSASLIAVVWQMGTLPLLGLAITPYSVLVPFLVFAIGMSHGAQKMNGVMQDIGRGTHRLIAARYTFRRLFLAGFVALICDATSFAVLMTIKIVAIQQLASIATIGVAILVITNLIMLPVMLSYVGVNKQAAARSLVTESKAGQPDIRHPIWKFLDLFTQKRFAAIALIAAAILGGIGWLVARHVQVGDVFEGAPELRQNSLYNRDNAYIVDHYAVGSDTLVVMVETPPNACMNYPIVYGISKLEWRLNQMPQVKSTSSAASFAEQSAMLLTEGSPKWFGIEPNQGLFDEIYLHLPRKLVNVTCTFDPIYVSLADHKAATLNAVVATVQKTLAEPGYSDTGAKFLLAGGNAGIAAATNNVIARANDIMLVLVFSVVTIFCLIAFRSWRATLCAVLPLVLTSILAQALMVWFGIGIKVATLPAIALGVGIGVDYALYVLTIMLKQLRAGTPLSEAYYFTLVSTGRVVLLTGFTLAAGVITWVFAPIKFQADMGLLLAFMFLWNMLGAMILLPALACFLLPPHIFAAEPLLSKPRTIAGGRAVS
jgi:predicted RND superfamily exporter protein